LSALRTFTAWNKILDCHAVGRAFGEDRRQPVVNLPQLFRKRGASRRGMAPLDTIRWRDPMLSTQP
jgi:hypothetical protein